MKNDPIVSTLGPVIGEERLSALLTWLDDSARTVSSFAAEQTPLLVQEVIAWGLWSNIITALMWAVALIIGQIVAHIFFRTGDKWRMETNHDSDGVVAMRIFGTLIRVLSCGFLIGVFYCTYYACKVAVAPRVWVLEYVHNLLQQAR